MPMLAGMTKGDIASLLVGPEGSRVNLKLLRQSSAGSSATSFVEASMERRKLEPEKRDD